MLKSSINKIQDSINDAHLQSLLKGSSTAFIIKISGTFLNLVFTLLITRYLGATAMGIFALSLTLLTISILFSKLGLDFLLLRFIPQYYSQNKIENAKEIYYKSVKWGLFLGSIVTLIVYFSAETIASYFFNKPNLAPYFKVVSIGILPLTLIFINSESLRGLKKIKEYTFLLNVARYLFAIMIIIPLMFFIKNAYSPVIAYVLAVIIIFFLSTYLWFKHNHFSTVKVKVNNWSHSSLLKNSVPMMLSSSLILVMFWTDTIMLGIFKTETDVGIYNVIVYVALSINISLYAVNSILAPKAVSRSRGRLAK